LDRIKQKNRRTWITTGLLLAVAVVGLAVIDISPGGAQPSAAEDAAVARVGNDLGTSVLPALIKMASALVVVVICIYGGIYLLKRLMAGKTRRRRGRLLEVVETTYVAPKKTVSLVRVADKAVLVGVTDSQISMLTELDADQTAALAAEPAEAETAEIPFGKMLHSAADHLKRFGWGKKETALETR
jgi:flagellar protein FliO/FliZ